MSEKIYKVLPAKNGQPKLYSIFEITKTDCGRERREEIKSENDFIFLMGICDTLNQTEQSGK